MAGQIPTAPQWIDWNSAPSYSTGYRKITNLYGGLPSDPDLKWMSYWNSSTTNQEQPAYIPVYETDPKYLWFLDQNSQKLKVSESDNPLTYTLNPVQDCYENKNGGDCSSDCCSTSSTLDKCMYSWNWGYAKNYGYFSFPKESTCDRWVYPIDVVQSTGQDISGTFCLNGRNTNHYMRTYLGCDGTIATNASHTDCVNIGTQSCDSSRTDDVYISSNPDPEGTRAEWQFIDQDIAFSCCTLDYETAQSGVNHQCNYGFNPSSAQNKCSPLIQDYCANYWNSSSATGQNCSRFLATSPSSCTTIQQTIQNYITSKSRGNYQDYVSKNLAKAGNPTSVAYYQSHNCNINQTCSDPNDPCCRDDSTDPFFAYNIPYLCNSGNDSCPISTLHDPSTGDLLGVCDAQLQYFCQSYTRDDLAVDPTLQRMCGCFLTIDPDAPITNPTIIGAPNMNLTEAGKTPANPSPYYTMSVDQATGASCDDLCNSASIQSKSFGGKCTQNVCVIDDVNITYVNSSTSSNSYITQNCGSGSSCYIQNVTINSVNSDTGGYDISQNCGSCYTFDDNILDATPVDCGTLQPYTPPSPPDNGGGGGSSTGTSLFSTKNILIFVIIAFLIFVIFFFMHSYFKNKSQRNANGIDGDITIDSSYWDEYGY